MGMQKTQLLRLLPAIGLVTLGGVALATNLNASSRNAAILPASNVEFGSSVSSHEPSANATTSHIFVDGKNVTSSAASHSSVVSTGNETAQVSIQHSSSTVQASPAPTATPAATDESVSKGSNINVSTDSSTAQPVSTSGSSRVFGLSLSRTNNGSSSEFSASSVFSSGLSRVRITP